MNKIVTLKTKMYSDIRLLTDKIGTLNDKILRLTEEESSLSEENRRLKDELENVYHTLKTIKDITKDSTIKTLCILKMQDIQNIDGMYICD